MTLAHVTVATVEILQFVRRDTDRTVREEFWNVTAAMAFPDCAESLPLSRYEGGGRLAEEASAQLS